MHWKVNALLALVFVTRRRGEQQQVRVMKLDTKTHKVSISLVLRAPGQDRNMTRSTKKHKPFGTHITKHFVQGNKSDLRELWQTGGIVLVNYFIEHLISRKKRALLL